MGKHITVIGLSFLGLAAFAVFAGWIFYAAGTVGGGWGAALGPIWPFVVGGLLMVAVLAGFLMWLAFYSANHGYDDPHKPDQR
jgi:hypothetical protein